jgi:cell wall assembly regulator SMI1
MSMQEFLDEISRHHFPKPPASLEEVEEFECRMGWRLDPDLRAFYLHCNGAHLFNQPGSPYKFLSLEKIVRARVVFSGEDDDRWGPASLYAICNVQDGNYILVDVARQQDGRYPIIDGYHEAFPNPDYCQQIASSFSEFLGKALRSEGYEFWLE